MLVLSEKPYSYRRHSAGVQFGWFTRRFLWFLLFWMKGRNRQTSVKMLTILKAAGVLLAAFLFLAAEGQGAS